MAYTPLLATFSAGTSGAWRIVEMRTLSGPALTAGPRLAVSHDGTVSESAVWSLSGVGSNMRYTTRDEADQLAARQAPLDRAEAIYAALIPISKSAEWWALAQDERRAIYEEQSRHTTIGLEYLPQIARKLHHCRDLGGQFDFLTWFEFAPQHQAAFDAMLLRMRASPEWRYVDHEIDIRLERACDRGG
ncbi:chlorite dismutase family protein [Sphingomonas psychrolutea]|uniref:Chlorite dismutase n=1 Tax=Sphingomonas psychrolutea TaxID=1259676 RepID=A0ABQ1GGX3_9SPHN|nr:chlorite dismutase family protein [Sphingomonas psychrolutea]GGA43609.1 hypothetical protein GCM10011395_12260 [Sphingomonas psychrolutea]